MGGHRYAHSGLWGCCRPERQGPGQVAGGSDLASSPRGGRALADPAGAVTSLAAVGSAGAASSGPGRDGSRTPLSGTFPCLGPRQASGARAVTRPEASSWALWGQSRARGCDRERRPIVTGISRACGTSLLSAARPARERQPRSARGSGAPAAGRGGSRHGGRWVPGILSASRAIPGARAARFSVLIWQARSGPGEEAPRLPWSERERQQCRARLRPFPFLTHPLRKWGCRMLPCTPEPLPRGRGSPLPGCTWQKHSSPGICSWK